MLAPWKKSYDQPRQHIKKQRHYFAKKIHLVKAMVFPGVRYGCESWTIRKAKHRRIDGFEPPILWPPDAKNWLIGKDSDAGKDWRQEEKGTTEGEMVGWHLRLSGHGFGWTLGVGDGQGGLVCCVHGVAKSRTRLSGWTELNWPSVSFAYNKDV